MAKKKEKETLMIMDLPKQLVETGHELWLAGLGAVATVEEEGSKLLKSLDTKSLRLGDLRKDGSKLLDDLQKEANKMINMLVKRGEKYQQEGRKQLTEAVEDVKKQTEKVTDKVEGEVKVVVDKALAGLNFPSRTEVQTLTKRVDQLSKNVEALTALMSKEVGKTPKKKTAVKAKKPVENVVKAVVDKLEKEDVAVFSVKADKAGWAVMKAGETKPLEVHNTKDTAVDAGRTLAKATVPSLLTIYKKDGAVQDTLSYHE